MAIKLVLLIWRHLLAGARVPSEIWTDHKHLESLKHMRWAELFSRFSFTLRHLPGQQNFLVDALSCLPQHDSVCVRPTQSIFTPSPLGVFAVTWSMSSASPLSVNLLERIKCVVMA